MLEKVELLSKGEQVKLRRASGRMLSEVDADTMSAFYHACSCKWEFEERVFPAACFLAGQGKNGSVKLPEAWKDYLKRKNSDSLDSRMIKLLDMQWGPNLVRSMWRIVKMMDRKDIDCESLAWDLIHWNEEDRRVQKAWLRIIYSNR